MAENSKCPVQRAIDRLKRFAAMLVPAVIRWIGGEPDFSAGSVASFKCRQVCCRASVVRS
jgi:hypothetical protein